MGVLGTQELIPGVTMGVHMNHADGRIGGDRLEDRIGDEVIAPGGQGRRARRVDAAVIVRYIDRGLR